MLLIFRNAGILKTENEIKEELQAWHCVYLPKFAFNHAKSSMK
jgi:hypothetical protein